MTQKQWKMISTIISIIIVVVFALYKAFGEQKTTNKSNTHSSSKSSQNASDSSFTGTNFDYFESMKKYPFKYVYGADGDTFHLSYEGKEFKVRLLIVDAPETAKEGKEAESAKVSVRNIRRDAIDQAKKAEKAKEITEDELHTLEKDIQKVTDDSVKNIDKLAANKEKELLEV